jgi:tetratricopeptide (TPR) repeat protein
VTVRAHWTIWGLALIGILCGEASADTLLLEDGRIIEDKPMERVEGGIKVKFENGDVVVPDRLIRDAILEKAPPYVPKTPKEKEKVDKGLVKFEGRWVKPAKRKDLIAKRIAARKEEVAKIREMSLWRNRGKEKTKHFEFEYTVPPHIFEYFRDLMEAYYKEFAKTWKIKQPRDLGKLKVCFYTNYSDFLQIGGVPNGVLGYFRFVEPIELNFYYNRLDPSQTEQVMYHEASHYLQKLLDPRFKMPHFPGEAIAEYYGGAEYNPRTKKLEVGLILESRLTEVKTDVDKGDMMGLEKLVSTDGMYQHYTWGWSLAHYLMNNSKYRKKFEKFVKTLVHGKGVKRESLGMDRLKAVSSQEVWRVFRQTMGLKKDDAVKAMEADWHAYIKDNLKLVTSSGLEKAASAAMNGYPRRPIRAKRLFREAIEAGTKNPMTFYRYADLLSDDGKFDEALKQLRRAVELEPLESAFYAAIGKAHKRKGEKDEAKKFFALAKELDPENAWLDIELEELESDDEGG